MIDDSTIKIPEPGTIRTYNLTVSLTEVDGARVVPVLEGGICDSEEEASIKSC